MAFRCWQLGLHLQQDNVLIVALQATRRGWALKRWWQLPLPPTISVAQSDDALLAVLTPWRRELPWQHSASIAFPASRTLQKSLPCAAMSLGENEQAQWIASAMAQQLEMASTALCFDYHLAEPQGVWNVTAAQQQGVDRLQHLAHRLRLHISAITPDACALRAFLPWLKTREALLVWRYQAQWLWASWEGWGQVALDDAPTLPQLSERLGVSLDQLVCCTAQTGECLSFDPWSALVQKQPPLPASGEGFAVAIALAMGSGNDAYRG